MTSIRTLSPLVPYSCMCKPSPKCQLSRSPQCRPSCLLTPGTGGAHRGWRLLREQCTPGRTGRAVSTRSQQGMKQDLLQAARYPWTPMWVHIYQLSAALLAHMGFNRTEYLLFVPLPHWNYYVPLKAVIAPNLGNQTGSSWYEQLRGFRGTLMENL